MFEIAMSNIPSCASRVLYFIRNEVKLTPNNPGKSDKIYNQVPQQPTPIKVKKEKNAEAPLAKRFSNLDEYRLTLGNPN
jgi:hypothetical protein